MKIATVVLAATMLVPTVPLFSLLPQADVPAEVNSARTALSGAYNDLQHAGGEWGGHRVTAMKHIQEAISELNQAESWAKQHHDVK